MWKMMTLSFLMYIFTATPIRVQVAADAAVACAACTEKYKLAGDTECPNLKTYLDCLETAAGTTDGCTLSPEDAKEITDATCTSGLDPPCQCQKEFWGSDLTDDKECAALKTYIGCLNKDATKFTCDGSTLASVLVTKPQGRSDSKCSTTSTSTTITTTTKGSGASQLRVYSAIALFLPFVLTAFRL
ncbi:uncharacterized protein LOC124112125 [Haliotis rufescens]|uniref:uncharacterized protein LOC124112125 n=1 Tax=Haliotis rufescens TaxID=6454 RepID=UPI00201F7A47|nr:uncharacterized protein LOC124112125 [Haliotis rufescens]